MAADGLIVLGLDVSQTKANVQTELNNILNNTKTKKIILQTAIEKTQTEQEVNAVVTQLNKKTVKLGVEINAKDVNGILAAQQKIASTQARLNNQMQEYRNTAREIGVTLNKDTWNTFNHAVSSGDFTKANEILKSAKKQIEEYNAAVKKMNSDTSVTGSVSSLIDQFSKLQNVSSETQSRVNLLRANLAQFENADNTQKKLASYKRLCIMIENLNRELKGLIFAERTQSSDLGIKKKIDDARSSLEIFKVKYDNIGDSASAQKVTQSITDLDAALDKVTADAAGGTLQKQWDAVSVAINNAKRAVAEYNAVQGVKAENMNLLSGISTQADSLLASVTNSGMSGTGIDTLKTQLGSAAEQARQLKSELDKTATTDEKYQTLINKVADLNKQFQQTKKDAKVFEDVNALEQFRTNIEKACQKVAEYDKTYSAIKGNPALVQNLNDLRTKLDAVSTPSEFKSWNTAFEQFNTKVKQAGLHTQSLGDKLKTAFQNFAQFFSASRLIYDVFRKLGEMVQNIKNLDASMINLRKVTDETDASYDRFLTNAKSKAVELGTTVKDLVDATTNFSRLGFSLQEAESLGQIATIYANVGDLNSIDEATNSLISTMKGFGIESEDALTTLDKFNEVGNNFAISSGDIGEALQRSASSMAAANNTIDETIALITAANTVVQDATSVGTAFKTISMRIRGATTEMEQAGLDMDGMASSTAKLREEIKALSGVDIMVDDATFKSTYQIIEELAAKWQDLTDIQQASITELIAGKRQGNIISAVMENFDIAENALKSSLGSAGSAMEEYNTYLDGIEAKTNQFKAAFETLSTTVMESDFLKGITEFGTQAITVFDNVIQSLGGMGNSLMMIVSIIALFHPAKTLAIIKTIFTAIGNFTGITKLAAGIKTLSNGWKEAKAAGLTFSQFLGNLKGQLLGTASAATIATAAITAIIAAITIAIAIYQNWKRKQEETRQNLIDEGNAASENSLKIAELTASYLEMCDAVDNGTASTEDLTNAQNEVISALELTGRSVRELTDEYGSLKDAIIAASQSQLKTNSSKAISGANAAKEQVEEYLRTGFWGSKSKIIQSTGNLSDEIMSYLKALGFNGIQNTAGHGGGQIFLPSVYSTGGDTSKVAFEDLMADYEYLKKMMDAISSEFNTNDNDLFDKVSELYLKYDKQLSSVYEIINKSNTAIAQELIFAAENDNIPKTTEEYIRVRNDLISKLQNSNNWDENGTYSAEGIIDSLLAENAAFQDIAKIVADEEAMATEIEKKRNYISELLVINDYKNLQYGTSDFYNEIDEYGLKIQKIKDQLKTLSDDDVNVAYDLLKIPDGTIESWDDLVYRINNYKNNVKTISDVHQELSSGLEQLDKIYADIIDKKDFDYSSILGNADFDKTFGDLDKYDDFIKTITNSPQDINACQNAFNDLTTSYINNSSALKDVTDSTRNTTIAMLEQMGISNAAQIVDQQLAYNKEYLKYTTNEYANMTYEEIAALYNECEAGTMTKEVLARIAIEKLNVNKAAINTSSDIDQLIALANSANASTKSMQNLTKAKLLFAQSESYTEKYKTAVKFKLPDEDIAEYLNESKKLADEADKLLNEPLQYNTFNSGEFKAKFTGGVASNKAIDSSKSKGSKSNSGTKSNTWFEKQYKEHQHRVAMQRESEEAFVKWLDSAYKRAYKERIITLDDFYKYEEEVFNKSIDLFDTYLNNMSHTIDMLDKSGGNTDKIVSLYREMQESVHNQAEKYRSMGFSENSKYIQDLQKKWWEYHDSIKDVMDSVYDEIISKHENAITLTESWLQQAIVSGNAIDISKYTGKIIQHYRDMQNTVHEQAEYYRSLGYAETSDEISGLSNAWWGYYEEIKNVSADAWKQVVDNANDAVDSIQSIYDTLKSAAQEFAEKGTLTVDTLQSIYELGVENLAYLEDENGLLVINEERIQQVIAARTQQMAIETALNYVQQLRTALTNNDTAALLNLTTATGAAATSTWELVYAQLQLLGLEDTQYNAALQRINILRSLADTAVTSVGMIDTSVKESLEATSTALDDLLSYVMDMIKQEVENQITALEDQVDRYKDIVDLQKESLELEREKDKYTKDVTEKTKSIADLQARITQLDLDDSREAQAEKKKLQEQLAEEQADLADTQADHAYDATNNMLDDMFDAYEKEKQKEIAVLEDSISSTEKLYQLAIDRINNHWDTLYNDLINWNYQYGNTVQSELISAWNNASAAVQEYDNYLNAVAATQAQIASFETGSFNTVGNMGNYGTSGGETMSRVQEIVAQMKSNSKQHHSEDAAGKVRLNKENLRLGEELENLIGRTVVRGDNGVWYLDKVGGKQLYSTYPYSTYHTGGIVGDQPTKQQDEMFALLEKREAVFTEPQQKHIYRVLKEDETFAAKLGISGLYRSMNGSGYAETQTQKAVMRDMQQAQNAAGNSQTIQSVGDVTVSVPVMVTEKLDKSDIRRLRKEISSVASEGIAEAFIKRGKGTLRDSLLKP